MFASVARLAAGRSAESSSRPIPGRQCTARSTGRERLLPEWVFCSDNADASAKLLAQAVSSFIAWPMAAVILSLFTVSVSLNNRNLAPGGNAVSRVGGAFECLLKRSQKKYFIWGRNADIRTNPLVIKDHKTGGKIRKRPFKRTITV